MSLPIVATALLLNIQFSFSQTYPVIATTILVPPFSGYLQDYTNSGNPKLKLLLTFNDFSKPSYNVKIKFKLTGQNVTIQSKQFYYLGPIALTPGVPLELSGDDLAQILNDNNLNFSGINYNDYVSRKVLPEGFYSFCFTVYDNDNPIAIPVSQEACAFAWMTHCDPPFLNLPLCNSVVPVTSPQQITFNWTCNNAGCPSSIANTEYDFELYEIFPNGQNPNNIIQSSAPIYTATIQQTLMNYGITEPPLQFGREYCWRVKARDANGYDYFKNNGWSSVCVFSYGSSTASVAGSIQLSLTALPLRHNAAKFSWSPNASLSSYRVEYRKTGSSSWSWFGMNTAQSIIVGSDLEEQTQYEARLRGILPSGDTTAWSATETFTTPAKAQITCNDDASAPSMQNFSPLTYLPNGSQLQIGQFELRITGLQNSASANGMYSGVGHIVMIGGLSVHVTFDNILVGSDYVVYQGEVRAITKGIDAWVYGILADQFGGNNTGDVVTGNTSTDESVNFNISSIAVDTSGTGITITITGTNGETETIYVAELPATILGANGIIYYVDENGNYGPAAQQNFMSPLNTAVLDTLDDKGIVYFSSFNKQYWGFDEWKNNFTGHQNIEKEYQLLTNSANSISYYVPQKSIRASGFDKVLFNLNNSQLNADSILFVSSKGTRFFIKKEGGQRQVLLVGGPANDAQVIYALHRDTLGNLYSLGKIKVAGYDVIQKEIVLVPIKVNSQTPSIDSAIIYKKINSFYKSSCIKYNVQCQQVFSETAWDLNSDGKLDVTGSGLLSQYTAEMKALNSAFKNARGKSDNKIYLFILPASSEQKVAGDMPRGKQFGYLFSNVLSTQEGMSRTVAHELGHGLFKLLHVFDNSIGFSEGTTNNLMDYSNDTLLYKFQWDQTHDPSTASTLFDADGEGMDIRANGMLPEELRNSDNQTYTFMTPAGTYLTLPSAIKKTVFKWGNKENRYKNVVPGTLLGFTWMIDGQEIDYVASISEDGFSFNGYTQLANPSVQLPVVLLPDEYNQLVIMGYPYKEAYHIEKIQTSEALVAYKTSETGSIKRTSLFPVHPYKSGNKVIYTYDPDPAKCQNCWGTGPSQINLEDLQFSDKHHGKPEFLHVLSIIENKAQFKTAFFNFSCVFDKWDNDWTQDLQVALYNPYWDPKMDQSTAYYTLWQSNPVAFYSFFRDSLENYIGLKMVESDLLFPVALQQKDPLLLVKALKFFSMERFKNIGISDRKLAISILLENKVDGDEMYEKLILDLLSFIEASDIDDLLTFIKGPNIVNANKKVLAQLVSNIDDSFIGIGDDNYKKLMRTFQYLCSLSPGFKAKLSAINESNFYKYSTKFEYTSIWKRCLDNLALSSPGVTAIYSAMDISDVSFKTSTELTSAGTVIIKQKKCVGGFNCVDIVDPLTLDPFDPVFLEDNSELSMIKEVTQNGGGVVPAIVLKYCEDKADNETAGDIINAAVDVASLAVGVGELKLAVSATKRALTIIDMASSLASLGNNFSDDAISNNPALQPFWSSMNLLTAGIGITDVAGISKLSANTEKNLAEASTLAAEAAKKSPTAVANAAKDFAEKTIALTEDPAAWAQLPLPTRAKAKVLLQKLLENSIAGGNQVLSDKLALALNKIDNIVQAASSTFQKTIDWFTNSPLVQKFQNNTVFKSNGVQIGHVENGAFILDKVTNLSDAEGEIVDVITDCKFKTSAAGEEINGDVTVFKNGNELQCVGGACFVKGTLIGMQKSFKTIENISVGDTVRSYNEKSGEMTFQKVVNVFKRTARKIICFVAGNDTTMATPEHPIYTERGWVNAGDLVNGIQIKTSSAFMATVLSVTAIDTNATVYNFEVENTHTYCVGRSQLVVHNDCNIKIKQICSTLQDESQQAELAKDLIANPALIVKFESNEISIEAWEILNNANRKTLRKDLEALSKLDKAMKNSNLQNFFTKEDWKNLCIMHGKCGHPGQTVETLLDNGDIISEEIGASLPFNKFIEGVDKLGDHKTTIPGAESVLKELCCNTNKKFKGAEWALRFTVEKNLWDEIDKFEEVVTTNGVNRRIDIRTIDGKRYELKCWKTWYSWSDQNFIDEFIKDLLQENISNIRWRFDKRTNFSDFVWLRSKMENCLMNNKSAFDNLDDVTWKKVFGFERPPGYLTSSSDINSFLNKSFTNIFVY